MMRVEHRQLIKQVAQRAHLPEDTVAGVLKAFVEVVIEAMTRQEKVVIRNFGVFRSITTNNGSHPSASVRFKPSLELRGIIKGALLPMEKYGVEMNNEEVLLAKVTGQCPTCKAALDQKDPPHCPNCGTTPFEKKVQRQTAVRNNVNFDTLYGNKKDEEEK